MKHGLLLFLYYQHKPLQTALFILTVVSFASMVVHLIMADLAVSFRSDQDSADQTSNVQNSHIASSVSFRSNQDSVDQSRHMAKLSAAMFIFLLLTLAVFPTQEFLAHLLVSSSLGLCTP